MYVFNALGLRCVKFLRQIMKHILNTIRTCGQASLREALIMQVASLSSIVRDHLRPYINNIFEVIEEFWKTRHLETILLLVEKLAFAMPDDIRSYAPALVRLMLTTFESARISDWKEEDIEMNSLRIELVSRNVRFLSSKGILSGHLHLVVPQLIKLVDSLVLLLSELSIATESNRGFMIAQNLALFVIDTITIILTSTGSSLHYAGTSYIETSTLSARTAQPLMRLLLNTHLNLKTGNTIIQLLCVCANNLGGQWISLYHASAIDAMNVWEKTVHPNRTDNDQMTGSSSILHYNETVTKINNNLEKSKRELSQGNNKNESILKATELSSSLKGTDIDFGVNSTADSSHISSILLRSSFHSIHQPSQLQVNQVNLQRAWDVSQRTSREDWEDWIKRFSVQLLREAPSPALRAAADLAHAYQPLARELFPAAFLCCWLELSEKYRTNLVHSLEAAFVADVSPDILQTLLNLAEFMEHDTIEGGLPIDISVLAELAEKCRAYSKALHYKEQEYVRGSGHAACIEALISINKKLELPDAALGILKATQMKFKEDYPPSSSIVLRGSGSRLEPMVGPDQGSHWGGIRVKESWLAELGNWKDALQLYEKRLNENPDDVNAILGCMRCYDARGDWKDVLELASQSWNALATADSSDSNLLRRRTSTNTVSEVDTKRFNESLKYISNESHREAIKYCSKAAWRLGQWDSLETFAAQLVRGEENLEVGPSFSNINQRGYVSNNIGVPIVDFDGAFFSAILHINRNEWALAEDAIDAARRALDSSFTALMSESYKRAYPSMVTAQTLSELEETIMYLKLESKAKAGIHRHGPTVVDACEARSRLLSTWRKRLSGCRVDAEVHSSIMAVRSLVLDATDEVDATLQLSSLSRQAKCFKLSERILCDPLMELGVTLDSKVFGFHVPSYLNWTPGYVEKTPIRLILSETSRTDSFHFNEKLRNYSHELVEEAGGVER